MTQEPTFSQPNYYELTGGEVQITYDPRDFDGVPRLTYQNPAAKDNVARSYSFVGSDIHIESSELGTEVSVRLLPSPSIEITEVTLLLPIINMGDKDQQSFSSFAILTTSRGGGGDAGARGPLRRRPDDAALEPASPPRAGERRRDRALLLA